jgi:hypothetical protein
MKKLLFLVLILYGFFLKVSAQDMPGQKNSNKDIDSVGTEKNAISIQALKHVVGIDYERIIYKNLGIALSAGISGVELEAKIHFIPQIKSPSAGFSSGYVWYMDKNNAWVTSRINMFFFEYRAKKRLTFMVGAGWFDYQDETKLRIRGGLGIYFPW